MAHDDLQRQPRLLGGRHDLAGRQQEPVAPRVPQLEGEGVLDALIVRPVDGSSARLILGEETAKRVTPPCRVAWGGVPPCPGKGGFGLCGSGAASLLTDGADDAAVRVLGAVQRRQSGDSLLGHLVLGWGDTERRKMRWGRLGAGCRKRFYTNAVGKNNARKVEFL